MARLLRRIRPTIVPARSEIRLWPCSEAKKRRYRPHIGVVSSILHIYMISSGGAVLARLLATPTRVDTLTEDMRRQDRAHTPPSPSRRIPSTSHRWSPPSMAEAALDRWASCARRATSISVRSRPSLQALVAAGMVFGCCASPCFLHCDGPPRPLAGRRPPVVIAERTRDGCATSFEMVVDQVSAGLVRDHSATLPARAARSRAGERGVVPKCLGGEADLVAPLSNYARARRFDVWPVFEPRRLDL
ncbi:hypothetical protein EXIGLDRAFT_31102 [Exidia glandulosa HHB12029]|uniref:Uncharacterized protein n=1 Tax=Exidia glandulosa HHB12029 TaxID=1314781 RepID=A0A165IW35_EXIGL|nr:hypothetical protein EXIGLDRAFT_31102 [Exidia glandulosa HHB12029]